MSLQSGLSAGISNLGSRLGLPEFKISEFVAGDSGNAGALNYSSPVNTALQQDRTFSGDQGTFPQTTQALGSQLQTVQTPTPTNNNVDLKDPNTNPGDNFFWDSADGWKQITDSLEPNNAEIDASFNPIFDVFNQAESNLREQQPGLIGEAEAQAQASRGLLQGQRTTADAQLGTQTQETQQRQQQGTAQQRQILQELGQANQARFGGASSAGQAASEIQGREFQRGVAGINQGAQQAFQQINLKKQEVERDYTQGLQQLEVNRQQAVNGINRTFQDRLLEIESQRAQTKQAKSQARMSAVADLRNAAFQINIQKAQFEHDLRLQAQQNVSFLDNAAQQFLGSQQGGQQASNQFANFQPQGISSVQGGQSAGPQQFTGSINDDDLRGRIAGSSATDPRFQNFQGGF